MLVSTSLKPVSQLTYHCTPQFCKPNSVRPCASPPAAPRQDNDQPRSRPSGPTPNHRPLLWRRGCPASHTEPTEALSVVSSIATEHRLRLETQPGDLIYINNWALLHARSSYKDCDEGSGTRRHLVRLWLRNSTLGWDIPTSMRVQWEAAFGPDGMADKNSENGWRKSEYRGSGRYSRNYPVMPAPEYKEPKYTSGSAAFVIEDDQGSDSYD